MCWGYEYDDGFAWSVIQRERERERERERMTWVF